MSYGILIPGMLGSGGRQAFPLVTLIVNPLPLMVNHPPPPILHFPSGGGHYAAGPQAFSEGCLRLKRRCMLYHLGVLVLGGLGFSLGFRV